MTLPSLIIAAGQWCWGHKMMLRSMWRLLTKLSVTAEDNMESDQFLLRKTKGIQKREHYCTLHFLYTTLCVYEKERDKKRERQRQSVCVNKPEQGGVLMWMPRLCELRDVRSPSPPVQLGCASLCWALNHFMLQSCHSRWTTAASGFFLSIYRGRRHLPLQMSFNHQC